MTNLGALNKQYEEKFGKAPTGRWSKDEEWLKKKIASFDSAPFRGNEVEKEKTIDKCIAENKKEIVTTSNATSVPVIVQSCFDIMIERGLTNKCTYTHEGRKYLFDLKNKLII